VARTDELHHGAPEFRLATAAARFCSVLVLPVAGAGWLVAGRAGLISAVLAAVLVTALQWMSAVVLAVCARLGGAALMVGGYAGFLGRLTLTAVVLATLQPLAAVHMPTLVIAAIALTLAVLVYESWHAARTPSFFWIERTRV
jgi:hypothetical protein